jgi:hypothetical protein
MAFLTGRAKVAFESPACSKPERRWSQVMDIEGGANKTHGTSSTSTLSDGGVQ